MEEAVADVMKAGLRSRPLRPTARKTSFVTIDGNEDGCKHSFSCSACSIDAGCGVDGVPYFVGCNLWLRTAIILVVCTVGKVFSPLQYCNANEVSPREHGGN